MRALKKLIKWVKGIFILLGIGVAGWYVLPPVLQKLTDREAPPPPVRFSAEGDRQIITGRIIKIETQTGVSYTTHVRGQKFQLISLHRYCQLSLVRGSCGKAPLGNDWSFRMPYPLVARRLHGNVDHLLLYTGNADKIELAIFPNRTGHFEWLLFTRPGWNRRGNDRARIRIWAGVTPAEPFVADSNHDGLYSAKDPKLPLDSYRKPKILFDAVGEGAAVSPKRWDSIDLGNDAIDHIAFIFACLAAPLSEGVEAPACRKAAPRPVKADIADDAPYKDRMFADRRARLGRARNQAARVRRLPHAGVSIEQCTDKALAGVLGAADLPVWLQAPDAAQTRRLVHFTAWGACDSIEGKKSYSELKPRVTAHFEALRAQ